MPTVTTRRRVDIPALKAAHSLGDFVEASGVELRGTGRVRQGLCPFHEETEGSFTVYSDTERWFCFGCNAGGDVLDFVQRAEGLNLPEAIERLAGGQGSVAAAATSRGTSPRGRADASRRVIAGAGGSKVGPHRDVAVLTAAGRFYSGALRRSRAARDYLASRGVDASAARRLGVGFSSGRGLVDALAARGFSQRRAHEAGLLINRGRERFAGMIVVPETDSGGRVRWLAGRALDGGAKPRFQSLPGPKPVLGLGRLARAGAATPSQVVVAEGLFDWLALSAWGIPACSGLGTHGVESVAASLRGVPQVFAGFDADDAGREAAAHLTALLGGRAAIVDLPRAIGDVGELAERPDGRAVFLRLLRQASDRRRRRMPTDSHAGD